MWSRPGISSARPAGSRAASSCAEPATSSLVPTATSTGARISRDLLARQGLARAADAGRERLEVGLGLLGKGRNVRPIGSRTSASEGASSASAMLSGSPTPSTRRMPSPPSTARRSRAGCAEREERGDARAHGVAHHVGAAELEMIDERAHVIGHACAVIGGGIVELGRGAVAAIVERDDAPAGLGQRRDPAGMNPVHLRGRGEAVHEHDRLALPFVEECDVDAVVPEALHADSVHVWPGLSSQVGSPTATLNVGQRDALPTMRGSGHSAEST